jgi:hypothetical protein
MYYVHNSGCDVLEIFVIIKSRTFLVQREVGLLLPRDPLDSLRESFAPQPEAQRFAACGLSILPHAVPLIQLPAIPQAKLLYRNEGHVYHKSPQDEKG